MQSGAVESTFQDLGSPFRFNAARPIIRANPREMTQSLLEQFLAAYDFYTPLYDSALRTF